ncbi:diol dehydratase small subunit [Caldanaerobius polysaccharolyticus]|uniref:diol dehydratase small subunit n=1 Tax=Caldanaerobius polysaccharolyticus TaxID=44256 RepID=UPI00047E4091|nr:diol dehydratase small subunit [Caldanaerobius polysaccharolyticus]
MAEYPLSRSDFGDIKSRTGKPLSEINMDNVLKGKIGLEDIKISKETLLKQGEIAERHGRPQLRKNFERAAELIDVPDEEILRIYNSLRPYRSTKEELIRIAQELKDRYNAVNCAQLVLEAAEVYEKRGIFRS